MRRITFLYQGASALAENEMTNNSTRFPDEDYILFVSGGRSEKNLARALSAFYQFKTRNDSRSKLYITGIDNKTVKNLINRLKVPKEFFDRQVKFYDYIEKNELAYLYRNCRYLLFVSKAEGFGLPILEALQYGKTSLSSWNTSIPEVAGSILYYVNAYSIDSIQKGMKYLADDSNLRYRESLVMKKREIIRKQIELDKEILLDEIAG